ncbi:hypothetical protein [Nitratireductor sp. XY-223]|uniref:hypothetical protein n=1 Tax=Nitratireductor sp. XY-223 TaxID=2561926 RepID=UPI0010AAC290|nr:hypothetical protein [Nitratireductor sp. XY-223]
MKILSHSLLAILISGAFFSFAFADDKPIDTTGLAVEKLSFDKSDTAALNIARRMYGRTFTYVKAIRVWLEEPNDDPEQLFLKVGTGRNCERDCYNIALFFNEQWLEIYRRPATDNLGLTTVGPMGMKSIVEDGRRWNWTGSNYAASVNMDGVTERRANEEELQLVNRQLGEDIDAVTATSFGPPDVYVHEMTLKTGGEKVIVVNSPYYCGQAACPAFVVNKDGRSFRKIYSIDGAIGVSKTLRDEHGYRGIETLSRNGVAVISPATGAILETIEPQPVSIAGTVK